MGGKPIGNLNGPWSIVFRIGLVLLPLTLAGVAYLTTATIRIEANQARMDTDIRKLQTLSEDITAIKASRFTAADGLAVWQAIAVIKEQIARIPLDNPPKWLIDRLDRIERALEGLQNERRTSIPRSSVDSFVSYVFHGKLWM